MNKPFRMLRALSTLLNPKHWGPFVEAAETTGFDHGFSVSWSQGGEDLALLSYLNGIENGSYIDVGAHHPDRFSVTRHLYQRGWSGLNVEANPALIASFEKRRPRDINLNYAVGLRKHYELAVFKEPAISTVNVEWRAKFEGHLQEIEKTLIVPGVTLFDLIEKYFPKTQLNLLTVDAEGSDFEVIQSLMFEKISRGKLPFFILVETSSHLEQVLQEESAQYLMSHGYELVANLPMSSLFRLAI